MQQISRIWDSMTPAQQRRLVILLGVIAVTTAALVSWSLRPSWALLYSDLSSQDAAAVADYLREQRVPYRLAQQGTAIEVPEDRVYELRLKTASKGLLGSSTVGLELFDRSTLPGTDFANRVNLQRALQGELARTIGAMKEVASARVHLVLPQKNLFGEETPARASVLVNLRGAKGALSHEQVAGIQTLVAQAVEGLSPEKVTVVDEHGRILGGQGGDSVLTAAQYESKVRYERLLRERLQSMMDAFVGPYKSVVQVEADVNSESQQVSQEQVQPIGGGQGALRRESVVKEDYSGGATSTGGPAGASSNLFGATAGTRPGGGGTYSHSEQTREYEFSRTTTKTIKPPGSIRRVSVAVLVDESVTADEQALVPVIQAAM
ncbi:MAG: flagellar M-ring protein FliF, partial [Armatimonadetes bacterium]|nr:flagellar M-ring protein FliF [Armatimonadota bacterium]